LDIITVTPVERTIWDYHPLVWIYLAISVFLLYKFLSGVFYLVYLERRSSYRKFNDLYIRKVRNIRGSFTFFNWIFLSDDIDENRNDYDAILKHEKAHAVLGHTYDLLFFELFKVCFWWLPTSWFINKEIRKIHEYQADAYALKAYDIDRYSSILISASLKSNGLGLASSFHDGLILKRLIAMKQQAKNVSPWKLGALTALSILLFLVFACNEELDTNASENQNSQGEVFELVEQQPEIVGGNESFYRYIADELKYPLQARRMGIEGRVFVTFVVEKDGSLSEVKAVKGIGAGCDAEAVRVVQNAPVLFKPGMQRGRPVRVQMTLPVVFKLNHDQINEDNSTQGMIILEETQTNLNKLKVDARYANGAWSGTVYDEEGEGLPGANIMVAGTPAGTVSDLDGSFKIEANKSNDLNVSFVGYETVRLTGN